MNQLQGWDPILETFSPKRVIFQNNLEAWTCPWRPLSVSAPLFACTNPAWTGVGWSTLRPEPSGDLVPLVWHRYPLPPAPLLKASERCCLTSLSLRGSLCLVMNPLAVGALTLAAAVWAVGLSWSPRPGQTATIRQPLSAFSGPAGPSGWPAAEPCVCLQPPRPQCSQSRAPPMPACSRAVWYQWPVSTLILLLKFLSLQPPDFLLVKMLPAKKGLFLGQFPQEPAWGCRRCTWRGQDPWTEPTRQGPSGLPPPRVPSS